MATTTVALPSCTSDAPDRAGAGVIRDAIGERQATGGGTGEMLLDSYGGVINRISPRATAFAHRDTRFCMQYLAYWNTADQQEQGVTWLRRFEQGLKPHVTGQKYVNSIDSDQRANPEADDGQNLVRLIDTRRRFGPDDVFRFRQGIPLSRPTH